MNVKPIKFEESNLYRHPDFALPPQDEQGQSMVKRETQRTPLRPNQVLRTRTEHLSESFAGEFDDDLDGNLFDGVDATEAHGEEVSFDTASAPTESAPRAIEAAKSSNGHHGPPSARTSPIRHTGPPRPPQPRMQAANAANGMNGQAAAQQPRPNQEPGRPPPNGPVVQRQPQAPIPQPNQPRPDQNRARMPPPTTDIHAPRPPIQQQQQNPPRHNQPLRQTPPDQQAANQPRPAAQVQGATTPLGNPPAPNGRAPTGFVTSRAAELLQTSDGTAPVHGLPTFDPNVESPVPKDKRTPGIDHRRSVAIKRQEVGAPAAPPPAAQPANSRTTGPGSGPNRPTNFVNPQQDMNRRIGMPGAPNYAMSPSANRGSGAYKPPTFANGAAGVKRERAPLQDVSNQGPNGHASSDGPDVKRQRVEASGTENTNGAVGT
jgi:hypothetical protein